MYQFIHLLYAWYYMNCQVQLNRFTQAKNRKHIILQTFIWLSKPKISQLSSIHIIQLMLTYISTVKLESYKNYVYCYKIELNVDLYFFYWSIEFIFQSRPFGLWTNKATRSMIDTTKLVAQLI